MHMMVLGDEAMMQRLIAYKTGLKNKIFKAN